MKRRRVNQVKLRPVGHHQRHRVPTAHTQPGQPGRDLPDPAGVVPQVIIVVAIAALTVLSFTVHLLSSPWLLVAIAILAWIKFRPRRSHQ